MLVEFDKKGYGGEDNLVEWNRTSLTSEGDGFEIQRKGSKPVKATIMLHLLHQPEQFRLAKFLSDMLGLHTCTRANAILALWEYIKVSFSLPSPPCPPNKITHTHIHTIN